MPSSNIVFARGWMTLEKVRDRGHFCNLYFVCVCVWLCWVFIAVGAFLSGCDKQGLLSRCGLWASHWGGFSCSRAWAPGHVGFGGFSVWAQKFGPWAPEHRSSSRGSGPSLLCGTWGLLGPGIKPMSPALAGRFFTTEPPGKPHFVSFDFTGCPCIFYRLILTQK